VDVVPVNDDQLGLTADDEDEPVLVDVSEIAGAEPAVDRRGGGVAVVAAHHGHRAHDELTDVLPPWWQRAILRVADFQVHTPDRLADAFDPPLRCASVGRRRPRGLRQAVALEDGDAEPALELVDRPGGHAGAAGDGQAHRAQGSLTAAGVVQQP
jgi:hypothetical protein